MPQSIMDALYSITIWTLFSISNILSYIYIIRVNFPFLCFLRRFMHRSVMQCSYQNNDKIATILWVKSIPYHNPIHSTAVRCGRSRGAAIIMSFWGNSILLSLNVYCQHTSTPNALRPSDAMWRHVIQSALVQLMACPLFAFMPLPMLGLKLMILLIGSPSEHFWGMVSACTEDM